MLISRRKTRRRIWRDFLRSMAALVGLSIMLFFCSIPVVKVTTNQTESLEYESFHSTNYDGRFGVLRASGASSAGAQRPNRMLQFMDLKAYDKDVPESDESVDRQKHTDERGTSVNNTFHLKQNQQGRIENNMSDLNKIDASVYVDSTHTKEINRTRPSAEFTTMNESVFISKLGEYKSNHYDVAQRLFPNNETKSTMSNTSIKIQTKRLPNAIIIGVKKAGTRALLEFLRLHPNVEGTGPEPHFFDRNYNKGLEWYRDLMPKTYDQQFTVEKTPGYFVTRDVPKRIFEMNPTIKLILVVRDPVTRAISDYCQAMSKHAMKSFEKMALLDERLGLVNTSWGAIKIGVYAKHMEHWLQVFSLDQIHLVDGQMLIEEPAREVAKVETFLGLPKYINDSHFYLRGFKGTFPCLIREGKPHCLDEKTKGRDHPVVKESVLQRLRDFYRPFNAKFFQMIGRRFDWS